MKCPYCNETEHEPTAKFCHKCGTILNSIKSSGSIEEGICDRKKQFEAMSRDGDKKIQRLEDAIDKLEAELVERDVPIQGNTRLSNSFAPKNLESIDLGLPSGTKWASFNVGATRPEEFGGYFAWGEVSEKAKYDWSNYTHCEGTIDSCRDIGANICGTRYDVANLRWGSRWQMPSSDQINELIENCRYEWTQVNGVNGGRFTGPNGMSIFLPATGYRDNSSDSISATGVVDVGFFAEYLSGSQSSPFIEYAFCLQLSNFGAEGRNTGRGFGNVIRPVEVQ